MHASVAAYAAPTSLLVTVDGRQQFGRLAVCRVGYPVINPCMESDRCWMLELAIDESSV